MGTHNHLSHYGVGAAHCHNHTPQRGYPQSHLHTVSRAWSVTMTHPLRGHIITRTHNAARSHKVTITHMGSHPSPSPSPIKSYRPKTSDPPGLSLQTLRDAHPEPSRAPRTQVAHLALPLPRRPRVPQASDGSALYAPGSLGNVVGARSARTRWLLAFGFSAPPGAKLHLFSPFGIAAKDLEIQIQSPHPRNKLPPKARPIPWSHMSPEK